MKNKRSRQIRVGLAAAAGAFGAAVMAALAPVAYADDVVYLVPEPATFDYSQISGTPPYVDASGTEYWEIYDGTTQQVVGTGVLSGEDTFTQFGSYSNNLIGVDAGSAVFSGDVIDYASYGGGYANEFIDITSQSAQGAPGISDLLITPFGDFDLFGSYPF